MGRAYQTFMPLNATVVHVHTHVVCQRCVSSVRLASQSTITYVYVRWDWCCTLCCQSDLGSGKKEKQKGDQGTPRWGTNLMIPVIMMLLTIATKWQTNQREVICSVSADRQSFVATSKCASTGIPESIKSMVYRKKMCLN